MVLDTRTGSNGLMQAKIRRIHASATERCISQPKTDEKRWKQATPPPSKQQNKAGCMH
jgi:hypothetical protein